MATAYDVVNTDYRATPRVLRTPDEVGGVLQFCRFEYEASALEAASTIHIGTPIPKGARIVEIVVLADDLGTSTTTLEVGDSGDTDRFIAAYASGSATFKSLTKDGKIDNLHYQFTADTQLLITTAVGAITGTIKGHFVYARV